MLGNLKFAQNNEEIQNKILDKLKLEFNKKNLGSIEYT